MRRNPLAFPQDPPVLANPPHRQLYEQLAQPCPTAEVRQQGAQFLRYQLEQYAHCSCDLPETPDDLYLWMQAGADQATQRYAEYLQSRKNGAPRQYFFNRAHALFFLQSVAPTKLVDGAWLYGVLSHGSNPRFAPLVQTYIEELGAGLADKNHVALYRRLMSQHGITLTPDLDDDLYIQGVVQLALGWNADEFLPEIVGFNLGYEQLPVHLLITAYELNELGIDPYYFTLHSTVDNAATGHARQACDAVLQLLPRYGDAGAFWKRVRRGSQLGHAGVGTCEAIGRFNAQAQVLRILENKRTAGAGMHSDYARIGGRSVNDWLAQPGQMGAFVTALIDAGWIQRNQCAQASRFWNLLQGERADMFGVFSAYELQTIHDWIRGSDSADGQAYFEIPAANQSRRRPTFRALQRAAGQAAAFPSRHWLEEMNDPDVRALSEHLSTLDTTARQQALRMAMSPAQHWTPVGMYATRLYMQGAAAA